MVSFNNFLSLDPDAVEVTRELAENADRQRSAFMSFVNTWMAFNGWMEAVTEANNDAQMITSLAENRRMITAYDSLMDQHQPFRRRVVTFSERWPVVNVRDARKKLGRDVLFRLSREDFANECRLQDVRFHPAGWTDGDIPTWPQLLRTIYAIRCNMFHGAKSPQNARDRELVLHSDRILRAFIDRTRCFEWHD
ncbi:hypothetical protein ACVWWG_006714 [Bradyrhizobium sp. LB7.2]|uniref:hypothetical protein n=1 Tax=Bradyrhizobium sp. LB14.3 TaxID=3156328 RepID=UPI003393F773